MPKNIKPTKRQTILPNCRFFLLLISYFLLLTSYLIHLPSYLIHLPSSILPLFPIVVLHLDNKDDDATRKSNKVGEEQVDVVDENTLNDEGKAAYGHHDETWQRNAVGVTCTNSLNSLRQIAEDKTDAGNPSTKMNKKIFIHSH